jgi:hypothetical protein
MVCKKADGTCQLGCFPYDTASSAQRVGISLVKGKRVSMVGKKAYWICRKPTGLVAWGVSPTILQVLHNVLAFPL